VDLDGVLPSATIMVVSVTASTTAGQPLPDAEIEQVRPAAAASAA
jgi:U4/U6 small nuclear ribonucleoprotein PRP31